MISVIVPIYNSEKYLERCIKSIIKQTYTDWELILVNDGSNDTSEDIINKYKQADSRIKSYWQGNAGAGAARNVGIRAAKGNYIVFVDSDDYLEKEYFELLDKHNEDLVFIDVNRRNENGQIIAVERLSKWKNNEKDDILRDQLTGKMLWGGVRKALKREHIIKNGILFSNHRVGEEAWFSFVALYKAATFSFIETPVYNYEVHQNSLSQTLDEDPWGDVSLSLREQLKKLGVYEIYANTENAFLLASNVISIDRMCRNEKYKSFKNKAINRNKKAHNLIDKSYPVDIRHLDIRVLILYVLIKMKLWFLVYSICRSR